jgi:site-specific recombinase XerD
LRPKDLNPARGTLRVLHGKGDRDRVVALDPEAAEILARWMDRRAQLGASGHHPVFCAVTEPVGRPLAQPWVRGLLRRLARKAGIAKRVHAHGLRHSFAQDLALEGKPLLVIQQALGHRRASTTSEYLHRVAPESLLAALRDRPAWGSPE